MGEKKVYSVADVAQFMFEECQKKNFLDQDTTADLIDKKFGSEFVSSTEAGRLSIKRNVIKKFKALVKATGKEAEWSSGKKSWDILTKKKL